MKEKDILYENGNYWVCKIKGVWYTMKTGTTHSESIVGFDDISLAICYAKYLGKHSKGGVK